MTTLLLIMSCLLQAPDAPQHLKPTNLHNGGLEDSANWGWYHPSTKSGGVLSKTGTARLADHPDDGSEFGSGKLLLLEAGASAVMNLADIRNRPLALHPGATYDVSWSQRVQVGTELAIQLIDGEMMVRNEIQEFGAREGWHRRHATLEVPAGAPKNMPYMLVFENRDLAEEGTRPALIDDISLAIVRDDSSDFQPLFDGRTLSGWTGATKGYRVKDGVIECDPETGFGGNLLTEAQFADFVLRFEFKLQPGSNNGIALRTPLEGDPAYVGMESQVLDNADPRYKGIKPWQRHASIYGIVPARPGFQRPAGEWNTEEIRLDGRQIKITLNGTVILDSDLDEATLNGTLSGREHPGLGRKSGHIGFCGHGDEVAYRSIRLQKLDPSPKTVDED